MRCRSIAGSAASTVVVVALFQACGGTSPSPAAPTPTPTPAPTTGTLTVKGATSTTGAFSVNRLLAYAPPQMLPGTPGSVKVRTYKVYLSANADCSGLTLVQDKGAAADYQDFVGKPTLFSASVAAGSYNCLAMKLSDLLRFTPDAAADAASGGVCTAGRETGFDILKTEDPVENWYDVDTGGTITGAGTYGIPVGQDVFLLMTTSSAAATAGNSRVHVHQIVPLANPIVITGSQVTNGAFVFDFANRMAVVSDGAGGKFCWLESVAAQFVRQ